MCGPVDAASGAHVRRAGRMKGIDSAELSALIHRQLRACVAIVPAPSAPKSALAGGCTVALTTGCPLRSPRCIGSMKKSVSCPFLWPRLVRASDSQSHRGSDAQKPPPVGASRARAALHPRGLEVAGDVEDHVRAPAARVVDRDPTVRVVGAVTPLDGTGPAPLTLSLTIESDPTVAFVAPVPLRVSRIRVGVRRSGGVVGEDAQDRESERTRQGERQRQVSRGAPVDDAA